MTIYGKNFYWQHCKAIGPNDRMQMAYRYRCRLSRQTPWAGWFGHGIGRT